MKKAENKKTEDMSSEELGLMLNDQYNSLLAIKANIQAINSELIKRKEDDGRQNKDKP